jgi:hypothetical protein
MLDAMAGSELTKEMPLDSVRPMLSSFRPNEIALPKTRFNSVNTYKVGPIEIECANRRSDQLQSPPKLTADSCATLGSPTKL